MKKVSIILLFSLSMFVLNAHDEGNCFGQSVKRMPLPNFPVKTHGMAYRFINGCWQFTKFCGGMGMIGAGFATLGCTFSAGCGMKLYSTYLDDQSYNQRGNGCLMYGAVASPLLWWLGWRSLKSGFKGLMEDE